VTAPVIGLDLGEKRIGVALSEGVLAATAGVIHRKGSRRDAEAVRALVERHGAERVIVGLPLTLSGHIGPQASATLEFVELLRGALAVPVETFDERYSSAEAEGVLRGQGEKGKDTRAQRERLRSRVDEVAAAGILQGWLDARCER
jgi:putative Holliday junction resolvase